MPLTDTQLADELMAAQAKEQMFRAALNTSDVAERDQVVIMLRHATALRRSLEGWIGVRAVRAARATAQAVR